MTANNQNERGRTSGLIMALIPKPRLALKADIEKCFFDICLGAMEEIET
jgi:hypothetical protein